MATNFSPCKGSNVLNQFPSNVMFDMNGFHILASGAIQGHHGPLVSLYYQNFTTVPMPVLGMDRIIYKYYPKRVNLRCVVKWVPGQYNNKNINELHGEISLNYA